VIFCSLIAQDSVLLHRYASFSVYCGQIDRADTYFEKALEVFLPLKLIKLIFLSSNRA
jgi:hypothetical protein